MLVGLGFYERRFENQKIVRHFFQQVFKVFLFFLFAESVE